MRSGPDRPRHDDARPDRARGAHRAAGRGALLGDAGYHAHGSRPGAGSRGGRRSGGQPLFAEALQPARAGIDRRRAPERRRMSASTGFPVRRLTALFVLLSLVPLALLTYFSLRLASDAVKRQVETRMKTTAAMSSEVVSEDIAGLSQVIASYAQRPSLVSALIDGNANGSELAFMEQILVELKRTRPGLQTAGFLDAKGTLLAVEPKTPGIIGQSFSFRDYYRGVRRTGR